MQIKMNVFYDGEFYSVKSINFNNQKVNVNGADILDMSEIDDYEIIEEED